MTAPMQYRRVSATSGKHGIGDYRVSFNGASPTHGELLAMLWWVFRAEDRYNGFGRRLLWWHVMRVYYQDAELVDIIRDVDGAEAVA